MQNTELNSVYKWVRIALILLVVFLGVSAVSGLKSLGQVEPAYNSITVSGEGQAFAIPDVANFSFSVSTDAKTVAEAQGAVTKKIDALLSALKGLGIDDKDVKTIDYSAYPKYVYNQVYCIQAPCPPQQKQDGYTVSQSISVKIRDTSMSGKALQVVADNGATNISGVNFTIDDQEKIVSEARAKAIADARGKANALAKQLGVSLVRVVGYTDNPGSMPVTYMKDMMGGASASTRPAPALPVGENKVTMSVSVTYEIR